MGTTLKDGILTSYLASRDLKINSEAFSGSAITTNSMSSLGESQRATSQVGGGLSQVPSDRQAISCPTCGEYLITYIRSKENSSIICNATMRLINNRPIIHLLFVIPYTAILRHIG